MVKTFHCRGLCLDSPAFTHIYTRNLERTKNVDLDLKFQKYQRERNKLETFHLKLDQNKSEYSAIFI